MPIAGETLEATAVPPTMLVGGHRVADETLRLHENSPTFDPERVAAHERFFVGPVGAWVRSRFCVTLPAERTALVFRRVVSWRSRLGFAVPTATARSLQPRPAPDTSHRTCCRARCPAPTSWPVRRSLFFSTR